MILLRLLLVLLGLALFLLYLPFWPLHWLSCRLTAQRCPKCGSKWRTTLVGEWGGEDWHCAACGHWWEVK
jgi:hypothetical protein